MISSTAAKTILAALAVLCAYGSAFFALRAFSMTARTDGHVVAVKIEVSGSGKKRYAPTVEFSTPDGVSHTVRGELSNLETRVGGWREVAYDPSRPNVASLDGQQYFLPFILAVFCVGLAENLFFRPRRTASAETPPLTAFDPSSAGSYRPKLPSRLPMLVFGLLAACSLLGGISDWDAGRMGSSPFLFFSTAAFGYAAYASYADRKFRSSVVSEGLCLKGSISALEASGLKVGGVSIKRCVVRATHPLDGESREYFATLPRISHPPIGSPVNVFVARTDPDEYFVDFTAYGFSSLPTPHFFPRRWGPRLTRFSRRGGKTRMFYADPSLVSHRILVYAVLFLVVAGSSLALAYGPFSLFESGPKGGGSVTFVLFLFFVISIFAAARVFQQNRRRERFLSNGVAVDAKYARHEAFAGAQGTIFTRIFFTYEDPVSGQRREHVELIAGDVGSRFEGRTERLLIDPHNPGEVFLYAPSSRP